MPPVFTHGPTEKTGTGLACPRSSPQYLTGLAGRLRIYLLRITERQGDKPRGIAHLRAHQYLMLALRLGLTQCLADIAGICTGLTANLEDYIPDLKALLGGRTIWFDRGDDDTLLARARHFTRWRYLQSEVRHATGWLGVVIFGACPLFIWHLRQCHHDTPGLALPNDIELD